MVPSADDPPVSPDPRTLVKATGLALLVALVVLVVAVLPAEHGVDPTGLGEAMGLTRLAEPEATAGPAVRVGGDGFQVHEANVTVPANGSLEWKIRVDEGAAVVFAWATDGPALFTDLHGEPSGGDAGEFTSWRRGTTSTQAGDLRAPFAGTVGWYWDNGGSDPVHVEVQVAGSFEVVGVLE